jgi:hypothetical protein
MRPLELSRRRPSPGVFGRNAVDNERSPTSWRDVEPGRSPLRAKCDVRQPTPRVIFHSIPAEASAPCIPTPRGMAGGSGSAQSTYAAFERGPFHSSRPTPLPPRGQSDGKSSTRSRMTCIASWYESTNTAKPVSMRITRVWYDSWNQVSSCLFPTRMLRLDMP